MPLILSSALAAETASSKTVANVTTSLDVSPEYCEKTFAEVDKLVQNKFWKADSIPAWKEKANELRPKIRSSKNLIELDRNINEALQSLHASHTQFMTTNDEIFYFLRSMFNFLGNKNPSVNMDFTGAAIGGVDCLPNQVRYVLDGSPAQDAGLRQGDEVISVDGVPFAGQSSFFNKSGKKVTMHIRRAATTDSNGSSTEKELSLTPRKAHDYKQYLDATEKSVRIINKGGHKIGYIHVWCGSNPEHEIIEDALSGKLQESDALVFDLRDGYGGNYYDDLDYFYRPPAGYPSFNTVDRDGKRYNNAIFYDKPVVTLINGGSRSGKELLAYSLKQTHRSQLIGTRTAGYVLGGRLFPINDRCSLYLAVQGPQAGSLDLEGKGVEPDVVVEQPCTDKGTSDKQLTTAIETLINKLNAR
jgi:carboxyl-terminal processing protease